MNENKGGGNKNKQKKLKKEKQHKILKYPLKATLWASVILRGW